MSPRTALALSGVGAVGDLLRCGLTVAKNGAEGTVATLVPGAPAAKALDLLLEACAKTRVSAVRECAEAILEVATEDRPCINNP